MQPIELKVARIGNSRGVRIPAATLERYQIGASIVMEERSEGILLRPHGPASPLLSWEDTAREMAAAAEDWSAWESLAGDGLNEIPWVDGRVSRVGERKAKYEGRTAKKSR
jgi:antitoxin component of MazEF toxin-antitoxin module